MNNIGKRIGNNDFGLVPSKRPKLDDQQNAFFFRASVEERPPQRQYLPPLERPNTLDLVEIYTPAQGDVDSEGNNPLHRAFRQFVPRHGDPKDPDFLSLIVKYVDLYEQYLNMQNQNGQTPLMVLIEQAPFVSLGDICKLLIQRGADPTLLDSKGKSVRNYLSQKTASYKDDLTREEEASIEQTRNLFDHCNVPSRKPVMSRDSNYPERPSYSQLHQRIFEEPVHGSMD